MGHVLPQRWCQGCVALPCSAQSGSAITAPTACCRLEEPLLLLSALQGLRIRPERNTLCQLRTAFSLLRAPAAKNQACATSVTLPRAGQRRGSCREAKLWDQGCHGPARLQEGPLGPAETFPNISPAAPMLKTDGWRPSRETSNKPNLLEDATC